MVQVRRLASALVPSLFYWVVLFWSVWVRVSTLVYCCRYCRHGWGIFIHLTCQDVLWYGVGICPSIRLSICRSVHKVLVNTIQTEPFKLGPSNFVHVLLMTRGQTLLISRSGVKGQGHMLHIVIQPCKHDADITVPVRTVKLGKHTTYDKRTTPIDFQSHGSKVKVTC